MARRTEATKPTPQPAKVVQDFADEALCPHHMPRDDSDVTCFRTIRASLGAEAFQLYLIGEIQRRAFILPSRLVNDEAGDSCVGDVERLEYFVAALRKELAG